MSWKRIIEQIRVDSKPLHVLILIKPFLSALVADVCLKDTMSVADSVYNLQLIREFCENNLQSCCPLAVEDLLYAPPALHVRTKIYNTHALYQIYQWTKCTFMHSKLNQEEKI